MTTNELSRDLLMIAGLLREGKPGDPWREMAAEKIEAAAQQIELDWNIIETYQVLLTKLSRLTTPAEETDPVTLTELAQLLQTCVRLPKVRTTTRVLGTRQEMTTRRMEG